MDGHLRDQKEGADVNDEDLISALDFFFPDVLDPCCKNCFFLSEISTCIKVGIPLTNQAIEKGHLGFGCFAYEEHR